MSAQDDIHRRTQEALAARLLHALEEAEEPEAAELLAGHLPACEACSAAAAELEEAVGSLAMAASARRPPPKVWQRIRRDLWPGRARSRVAGAVAAAAVVAVGGLVALNLSLAGRVDRTEARREATAAALSAMSRPSSRVVPLAFEPGVRGAPAELSVAMAPGDAVMYVFGTLPVPPEGTAYQVWTVSGEERRPGPAFGSGGGEVLVEVAADPRRVDAVEVTIEPRGGSRTPSGSPVARADL